MGHTLKKIPGLALGIALVITVAPNSKADITTTYDTSLTSPGVYFGGGNANTNFTTETDGTTELGLSVIQRYVGPIDPGAGSNVYQVSPGTITVPGKTGSSWGFDFSINTQYNGGSDVLDDFTYSLNITDLTTSNVGPTFDPLLSIPDNTYYGPGVVLPDSTVTSSEYGAQNSEALSFAGFLPGYNINATDEYQITLSELNTTTGAVIETDTVFANAASVPEPSAILLLATMCLALAPVFRRRQAKSARLE